MEPLQHSHCERLAAQRTTPETLPWQLQIPEAQQTAESAALLARCAQTLEWPCMPRHSNSGASGQAPAAADTQRMLQHASSISATLLHESGALALALIDRLLTHMAAEIEDYNVATDHMQRNCADMLRTTRMWPGEEVPTQMNAAKELLSSGKPQGALRQWRSSLSLLVHYCSNPPFTFPTADRFELSDACVLKDLLTARMRARMARPAKVWHSFCTSLPAVLLTALSPPSGPCIAGLHL